MPHEVDRGAVERDEEDAGVAAPRPRATASRRSSRRTSCARPPPRAARRATARARTRAARSRRPRRRSGARCDAIPVSSCSRTPASVASSGSTAWVAALVQVTCGAKAAIRSPRRSSASAAAASARPSTRAAPPAPCAASSACDAGRTSRRNARQRSSAPGASSWSASTGVIESVTWPGWRVEHVQQRQVAGRDRLPQPLLAERPRPEALDVGHVGVQDDAQSLHGRSTASRSRLRSRPARRSVKSRALIAGVKRS